MRIGLGGYSYEDGWEGVYIDVAEQRKMAGCVYMKDESTRRLKRTCTYLPVSSLLMES
jgi:hypothetical protein